VGILFLGGGEKEGFRETCDRKIKGCLQAAPSRFGGSYDSAGDPFF